MTTNRHPEFNLEDYTKDNPELAKEVEKEMKRITNYEKIKAMSIDEMAEWLEYFVYTYTSGNICYEDAKEILLESEG